MVKKVIVASIDKDLYEVIESMYLKKVEECAKKSRKPISKSKIIELLLYAGWYSITRNIIKEDYIEKEIKKKLM